MKLNYKTRILGEKIVLLPYKKIHVEKYHGWMQSDELLELTASEPLSLEQEYAMQNAWFEDEDKCTFIIMDKSILERTNDEIDSMIGDVNLYLNENDDVKTAEVEVMIADPNHRCMGKGKEALLFMLRYGVDCLDLKKFIAKIKMKNENSIHLFKSIGFKEIPKINRWCQIHTQSTLFRLWTHDFPLSGPFLCRALGSKTGKSEFFQEIELICYSDDGWKNILYNRTKMYQIEKH